MKSTKLVCMTIATVWLISANVSCKKDKHRIYSSGGNGGSSTSILIDTGAAVTPPKTFAGQYIYVNYPADSCTLNGSYSKYTYDVVEIIWRQINGAPGAIIENHQNLSTVVRGLNIGEYEFELTVKDSHGFGSKDSVKVYVNQIGDNEIVFTGLNWNFPWYPTLIIKNIHSYFAPGPIKVYIRRSQSINWQEVPLCCTNASGVKYEYFIESRPDGAGMYNPGSLNIFYYGFDTHDTPDVKVVY